MHKNSSGFAHLGLLLCVVIVVASVGGVGYYVFAKQKKNDPTSTNETSMTATVSKQTEVTDAKDIISKVSTEIPREFSQVSIDTRGASTGNLGYKLPDYAFVVSTRVAQGQFVDFKPSSGDTLDTLPAGLQASIAQKFKTAGYSEDTSQPMPGFVSSSPGSSLTYYKKGDIRCSVSLSPGSSTPLTAACANINDIKADAKIVKPFDDVYKAANKTSSSALFSIGSQGIKTSETSGYKKAAIGFGDYEGGGGFRVLFYSKNNGPWVYFSAGQMEPACSDFNTPDIKAAFKGDACYDSVADKESTVQ